MQNSLNAKEPSADRPPSDNPFRPRRFNLGLVQSISLLLCCTPCTVLLCSIKATATQRILIRPTVPAVLQ